MPHLWTVIAGQFFGIASDLILKRGILSKSPLRKIMHTFGFLVPAIGLVLLGYITNDWKISVAIMTIGYGFRGAAYSGHTLVIFSDYFIYSRVPNKRGSLIHVQSGTFLNIY